MFLKTVVAFKNFVILLTRRGIYNFSLRFYLFNFRVSKTSKLDRKIVTCIMPQYTYLVSKLCRPSIRTIHVFVVKILEN